MFISSTLSDDVIAQALSYAKQNGVTLDQFIETALLRQIEHEARNTAFKTIVDAVKVTPRDTVVDVSRLIDLHAGSDVNKRSMLRRLHSYLTGKKIAVAAGSDKCLVTRL